MQDCALTREVCVTIVFVQPWNLIYGFKPYSTKIAQVISETFFPANLDFVPKKLNLRQQKWTTHEQKALVKTEKKHTKTRTKS